MQNVPYTRHVYGIFQIILRMRGLRFFNFQEPKSELEAVVKGGTAEDVLTCLQKGFPQPSFDITSSTLEEDAKCVLLVLSGQHLLTKIAFSDMRREKQIEWQQRIDIMVKIMDDRRRKIDMKKVTMDQVLKLVAIMHECEPPYDTAPRYHHDDEDQTREEQLESELQCGMYNSARNLLLDYPSLQPRAITILIASQNGYVGATELAILAGARMSQCDSKRWPWWVNHTEKRLVAVQESIADATSTFYSMTQEFFPQEILEKIIDYVTASRFDLKVWKRQRDWSVQTQRVMQILNME